MLITNFASGELSRTLFGRTDLGQYYQGASRLENFDVIPTGGIERRNGTKRLAAMEREGRIIPFIVDREHHYLLYLTPEARDGGAVITPARISVYHNQTQISCVENTFGIVDAGIVQGGTGYEVNDVLSLGAGGAEIKVLEVDGAGAVLKLNVTRTGSYSSDIKGVYNLPGGSGTGVTADITSIEILALYKNLDQINQVQYSQKFDKMIFVHEDYQPLLLRLVDDGRKIIIEKFDANIITGVVIANGLEKDRDNYIEPDEKYAENRWLIEEGKYPSCVSFFQGRLVFANTKSSRQRLFFSAVDDITKFATYKIFVTEKKTYITVLGTITHGSDTVAIDTDEYIKFANSRRSAVNRGEYNEWLVGSQE